MIFELSNRSIIKVFGPDAEDFLQSQFTNDIKVINESKIQLNAYCQHQGKITSLLWVFKKSENFYISLPKSLKDIILSKLKVFRMMSNLEIEDYSDVIYQYGIVSENIEGGMHIINNLFLKISRQKISHINDLSIWEYECIQNKLPEVDLISTEKYVPQSLDLDLNGLGVSFSKGCYPGQEVVARMHYLGKPKRRLFRFISKFEVSIGDNLDVQNSNSLKSSGQVIRVAKESGKFLFLGVLELSHLNDEIFLNNDQNKIVKLIHE